MNARTLVVCVAALAVMGGASRARAQSKVLDEAEVIRLVRGADPSVASAQARLAAAAALEVGAGRYPNPELGWEREHVPGAGESEDVVGLTVPIAFSGERAARSSLARAERAAAEADMLLARSEATQRVLDLFYAALAEAERVRVLSAVVEQLGAGAAVLARRHEEGAASGYERTRLDLELALARSEQRVAKLRADALGSRLAAVLGFPEATLVLRGELDPGVTTGVDAASERRSRALDAEAARLASQARSDADSAWIPTLHVKGGVKIVDAGATEVGYVAGLGFELPFSSPGAGLQAEASARAAEAEARGAERARAQDVSVRDAGLLRTASAREVATLDAETGALLDALDRAATSGYREGQRSLVELLDAQRARTSVALRRIDLLLAARQAEVGWRAAKGAFE